MSFLCRPCRLWRHRPARPTRSARRAGRWGSWAIRRLARWCVWRGIPVGIRHHTGTFGLHLLTVTPVQPVEILVAPRRHVSKGTWG
jgi:hypothetical protein